MSGDLVITPLDPADDAALREWHATYLAASTYQRPHATPWMLEEVRADLCDSENPGSRSQAWTGTVDGQVVVTGLFEITLLDNLHQSFLDVNTHPEHRRRGHGSAMLAHLEAVARDHDRTTACAEVSYPYDGPADGTGHEGVEFLRRRGFDLAIGDVQRVLDLPVEESLLESLIDEAAPHHADYRIRQFVGPVPDDILVSFAELIGALVTEAPMGSLDLETEVFDEARIRADEKKFEASGRTKYTTVAIAPDGTVAAYSELVVPRHDPGRVYQWGTLARRDHRGHRLGLATKARNLLWLQREQPDARLLSTFNAEVNAHMIGVNERMGFRPVERLGEFQKRLTD